MYIKHEKISFLTYDEKKTSLSISQCLHKPKSNENKNYKLLSKILH